VRLRLPESEARVLLVVVRLLLVVLRPPESEAIAEVFMPRLIARASIFVSCAVLVPWSFSNAERIESADVTIHDPATNPERRDVRLSLLLKVFQSPAESAPVVVALASARESSCPERERPLATPRVTGS
jgi:hypothetical protein